MIKAVLFDIDGVLIDSLEANVKFYNEVFKAFGYKTFSREEFIPYFPMTMRDVIADVTKADDKEVERIWDEAKGSRFNYPYSDLKNPDGCEDVLKELGRKYLLGLVTSRVKGGIFKIPILGRNKNIFIENVGYEDTRKHKPDPEPLVVACKKLNIKPEEAVYVGDQEVDMLAARGANMKVLLFSKENFGNTDLYTDDFKEIPQLISVL